MSDPSIRGRSWRFSLREGLWGSVSGSCTLGTSVLVPVRATESGDLRRSPTPAAGAGVRPRQGRRCWRPTPTPGYPVSRGPDNALPRPRGTPYPGVGSTAARRSGQQRPRQGSRTWEGQSESAVTDRGQPRGEKGSARRIANPPAGVDMSSRRTSTGGLPGSSPDQERRRGAGRIRGRAGGPGARGEGAGDGGWTRRRGGRGGVSR